MTAIRTSETIITTARDITTITVSMIAEIYTAGISGSDRTFKVKGVMFIAMSFDTLAIHILASERLKTTKYEINEKSIF